MKRSWSSAWRLAGSSSSTAMASPCSPIGRACSCSALARGTSASAAGSGVSRLGSTMCWPSQAAISARSCSALSAPASTSSWPSWRRGLLVFCCCCSAVRTCSGLTSPWLTSSCPRWRMGARAAVSSGSGGSPPGLCSSAHSACRLAGRAMAAAPAPAAAPTAGGGGTAGVAFMGGSWVRRAIPHGQRWGGFCKSLRGCRCWSIQRSKSLHMERTSVALGISRACSSSMVTTGMPCCTPP